MFKEERLINTSSIVDVERHLSIVIMGQERLYFEAIFLKDSKNFQKRLKACSFVDTDKSDENNCTLNATHIFPLSTSGP